MDYLGGPLDDAFNPPPRYLLESDSEDELGDDVTSRKQKTAPPAKLDISSDILFAAGTELHLIVCVGPAAQRIVPSLFTGAQGVDVKIGGIPIAIYTFVSPYICVLSASSYLPVTTLHELSQWIVGTVSPTRISIVDAYAIPSYIETSSRSSSSQTVRYLRTATRTSNTQSDPLPSEVQPFSPPNLLSTQTLSSSLMCLAQQVHLSPKTTLRQPTLLLLLPYPHIKRSPPRTLTHECEYRTGTRQELEDLASIWHDDALRVVYRALDVERAGVPFFADSAGKAGSGGSQTRSRQSVAENSMYI